ncbi:hypothetical protein L6452_36288 [Arctium lappa]|uniref:Uncharacterized protein n=1 Tax=Arctium lappa TaxID=4217 RepID=A0ACB8Y9W7_ARCLA|nr:hypothetical protein L6452_36288 [Arctium lappa]
MLVSTTLVNLAMLGSLTIVVAHHLYAMPPYPYLATDYGTQLSLFTHHMWIGGFLIVGAAVHATIFMVRDYDPTTRYNDLLDRVLRHRDAIISHLPPPDFTISLDMDDDNAYNNWSNEGKGVVAVTKLGSTRIVVLVLLQSLFSLWLPEFHPPFCPIATDLRTLS